MSFFKALFILLFCFQASQAVVVSVYDPHLVYGSSVDLFWFSQGTFNPPREGNIVDLYLCEGNTPNSRCVYSIAQEVPDNGIHHWTVDNEIPEGKYFIRIEATAEPGNFAWSQLVKVARHHIEASMDSQINTDDGIEVVNNAVFDEHKEVGEAAVTSVDFENSTTHVAGFQYAYRKHVSFNKSFLKKPNVFLTTVGVNMYAGCAPFGYKAVAEQVTWRGFDLVVLAVDEVTQGKFSYFAY